MLINDLPSDARKLIYPWLSYKGLLAGRAVCRKWRGEIESLWPLFEKCSFADFKETSWVIRNLKKEVFVVQKFEFPGSFDNSKFLAYGNLMLRVVTVWYRDKNRYLTCLESINTETQEKNWKDVVLGWEMSPNLSEIRDRGLMEVPERSYYKDIPNLFRCNSEFICLYRFNLFSIWNINTLQCVFWQPNLGKQILFRAKNNIGYVTLCKNQIEIWNYLTRKLIFSQTMGKEISSCSDQMEDWIHVTFAHSQEVCFVNATNSQTQLTVDYPINEWQINNGKLYCISSGNRFLEIFCLKTGNSLLQSKHMSHLTIPDQFTQLKADSLDICDTSSLETVHRFPRPNITRIVASCFWKDRNRLCFLCQRNPSGLELLFLDLRTQKFFGDHVFKELHIERNHARLSIIANCYTFLYRNNSKEYALFYDPKTAFLIRKMEFEGEGSVHLDDRTYEVLNTKAFKVYRFTEAKNTTTHGSLLKSIFS